MIDQQITDEIHKRLRDIEVRECVHILVAVESGSRAWGFPSPDSDYDCRFLYVRSVDAYLSLYPLRDVIERPATSVYDINGWDISKTLKLLVRDNAIPIEWLVSPIHYIANPHFTESLLNFAMQVVDRNKLMRHYLHLGERQRRVYFGDGKSVPRKKIFYALRPAAALRWLRFHPDAVIAPMNFPQLMSECDPPPNVYRVAADLITEKETGSEMGYAPLDPVLSRFIDEQFEMARGIKYTHDMMVSARNRGLADDFFRSVVK